MTDVAVFRQIFPLLLRERLTFLVSTHHMIILCTLNICIKTKMPDVGQNMRCSVIIIPRMYMHRVNISGEKIRNILI